MDEQQLRSLVRAAIARHHGHAPLAPAAAMPVPAPVAADLVQAVTGHASVMRFHIARNPGETECVIEPSVTCNHCGHCLCYGH